MAPGAELPAAMSQPKDNRWRGETKDEKRFAAIRAGSRINSLSAVGNSSQWPSGNSHPTRSLPKLRLRQAESLDQARNLVSCAMRGKFLLLPSPRLRSSSTPQKTDLLLLPPPFSRNRRLSGAAKKPQPAAAKKGDYFQLLDIPLYDRLGGDDAMEIVVDVFYRKVLEGNLVSKFFEDVE